MSIRTREFKHANCFFVLFLILLIIVSCSTANRDSFSTRSTNNKKSLGFKDSFGSNRNKKISLFGKDSYSSPVTSYKPLKFKDSFGKNSGGNKHTKNKRNDSFSTTVRKNKTLKFNDSFSTRKKSNKSQYHKRDSYSTKSKDKYPGYQSTDRKWYQIFKKKRSKMGGKKHQKLRFKEPRTRKKRKKKKPDLGLFKT